MQARINTFRNSPGRTPILPQNVQRDTASRVNVRMINSCLETDSWGRDRIASIREHDAKDKDASLVWSVGLGRVFAEIDVHR
jgi:hypothetical protein